MALLDLLNKGSSKSLSSKWSISVFTGKKKNKYVPTNEISGLPKEDVVELTLEIAQLQQALSKYIASNERKGSSVRTSLTELEMYIKELKDSNARPDFVTAAYGTKSDLLKTMDKFDDNNWKATLDAVKTKKDIRKYYFDKNKVNAVQTPVEATQVQSGGAVGTMVNVYPNGIGSSTPNEMRSFNPGVYRPPLEVVSEPTNFTSDQIRSVVDAGESIKEVSGIPQSGVTVGDSAQPPVTDNLKIYDSNVTVQEGLLPDQNVSTNALNSEALRVYEQRKNMTLENAGMTELGHDYKTSINGMMSKADNIEPIMYINQIDGSYYIKAYYRDEYGNVDETREYPHFNYPSLLHIEKLEMSPSGDKIKCFAYKQGLKYRFVDSNDDMPEVYKNYWKLPQNQNYYIPENQLETMRRMGMKANANN